MDGTFDSTFNQGSVNNAALGILPSSDGGVYTLGKRNNISRCIITRLIKLANVRSTLVLISAGYYTKWSK
jgi:hypothetical protein